MCPGGLRTQLANSSSPTPNHRSLAIQDDTSSHVTWALVSGEHTGFGILELKIKSHQH